MAQLAALEVSDSAEAWASVSFTVDGGVCTVGSVIHRFSSREGKGVTAWELTDLDLPSTTTAIEGLPTTVVPSSDARAPVHPNGVAAIDHVVVVTPDHVRTLGALQNYGLTLLRTRQSSTYGSPMVQGFFRLGPVILEVIGPPQPVGDGPAAFFGLAFTVADLDATARLLGAGLHAAKDAVQAGRRIATLDRSTGVRTPMAFMSPEPRP